MTKKKPAVKKDVPAKKSKEIAESSKTKTPEKQKGLTASVKIEDGGTTCTLNLSKKDDFEALIKSTGCKVLYAAQAVITTGMAAVAVGVKDQGDLENAYNGYLAMMAELKPQDVYEGVLVSQMSVTHMQAMDSLRMAANNKDRSKIYERFQNQGIKLMRLYNYQLETLDKHRRKGKQKMIVEHVNVHKGGQAIVGEVHQGGEGVSNEN